MIQNTEKVVWIGVELGTPSVREIADEIHGNTV